ncbi:hypothetical protein Bca4012_059345 [Brassica carinata]
MARFAGLTKGQTRSNSQKDSTPIAGDFEADAAIATIVAEEEILPSVESVDIVSEPLGLLVNDVLVNPISAPIGAASPFSDEPVPAGSTEFTSQVSNGKEDDEDVDASHSLQEVLKLREC